MQQRPVLLRGFVNEWRAFRRWTPDYFKGSHGNLTVRVYERRETTEPTTTKMKLGEYMTYVEEQVLKIDMVGSVSSHFIPFHSVSFRFIPCHLYSSTSIADRGAT